MTERTPYVYLAPHIVLRESVVGPQPYIDRIAFKVRILVELYQAGTTVDDFIEDYDLTRAEVHAALAYYYDHQAEIDERIAEGDRMVQEHIAQHPESDLRARFAQIVQ